MQGSAARKGFTGLEALIVLLLIGALIGVLVYGTGFFQRRSRNEQRTRFMKEISVALEAYNGAHEHYPRVGDPIVGGAVVSGSNNFNSMIAVLGQGSYLQSSKLVDPLLGALFGKFNGIDKYQDGAKFAQKDIKCEGNGAEAQVGALGGVAYAYYTDNGEEYVMCLVNEDGKTATFVNPKGW